MDKSPIPNISGSPLDLSEIVENQKKDFFAELIKIDSTKTIIFEPIVYEAFCLFINLSQTMSQYQIDHIYDIGSDISEVSENVLFFIRPNIETTRKVCNLIQYFTENNKNVACYVYFLPCKTYISTQVFKAQGVIPKDIRELNIDLFPLDKDLLTMMFDDNYENLYLKNKTEQLEFFSNALLKIQNLYGSFPIISSFGGQCDTIVHLIDRLKHIINNEENTSEISQCILFDRAADQITPLLTSHTLLSLIDDEYEVIGTHISVPKSVLNKVSAEGEDGSMKFIVNNTDMAYSLFADMNINVCYKNIIKVSEEFRKQREEMLQRNQEQPTRSTDELMKDLQTLKEINKAQSCLPDYHSFINHYTSIITSYSFRQNYDIERSCIENNSIYDFIMDHITIKDPIENILRLIALYSLINNGIKQKQYDAIQKEMLLVYGFPTLLSIHTMQQLGFFKIHDSNSNWSSFSKLLKLVNSDVNLDTEDDMSYVTSYFAPLSCRLIQLAITRPTVIKTDLQKYLSKPYTEIVQQTVSVPRSNGKKIILVCFIGGITYAEIAALRQLNRVKSNNVEIIILTTHIINGKRIMKQIVSKL